MNFENYQRDKFNQASFTAAVTFIQSNKSLYLYGNSGNGKTHLMVAAYRQALQKECSYFVGYYNVAKLLKIERLEFESKEEAEERFLNTLSKKRIIFLDDFCAENITGRTAEFLYLLFNDAIENGFQKFFITGNKSVKYISESISDRIGSRIVGLCGKAGIIKNDSPDRRLQ